MITTNEVLQVNTTMSIDLMNGVPAGGCFADLGLAKPILRALTQAGYHSPTPIQAQAIPAALAGSDLLLSAQTGSGKTAAFVLPILQRLADKKTKGTAVRAVILTPTRELALQVQDNVRSYSTEMQGIFSVPLVGGAAYGGQLRALRKGVQIIVATPGRFIDHLKAGRIDLSALEVLVLDEADRMLDMGFSEDIDTIIAAAPSKRQTIMSSATWDGAVGKIAERFTVNPKRIAIKVASAHIDERVYFCDDFQHKNNILCEVLNNPQIKQAVIFAGTKMSAERLAGELGDMGYHARCLHGDLPQAKRNRIVSEVKSGKCQFLVATDVASRGIDIASISHVINYDLPRQPEDYVHRIGRCGRAGRSGVAINLCSVDDRNLLAAINRYLKRPMKSDVVLGLEPKKPAFDARSEGNKRKHSRRGRTVIGTNHAKVKKRTPCNTDDSALVLDAASTWMLRRERKIKNTQSKGGRRQPTQVTKLDKVGKSTDQDMSVHQSVGAHKRSKQYGTVRAQSVAKKTHDQQRQNKGVVEFLFHQTAVKYRRFGDK